MTLTRGVLVQSLEEEALVARRAFLAQLHRPVVLPGRADVVVAVAHRHQGADVHSSDVFVKEKLPHFTVGTDALQTVFVLHQLVNRANGERLKGCIYTFRKTFTSIHKGPYVVERKLICCL